MIHILILGASGMLGNTLFRRYAADNSLQVTGTVRRMPDHPWFTGLRDRLIDGVDVGDVVSLRNRITRIKPDVLVNCIGVVKQLAASKNPLDSIPINSLLPHQLAEICGDIDARLIQISTDCVFSGSRGNYCESDFADADDLYGRSKLLGEVDYPHAITLRTSIIGHEMQGNRSLVDWFLSQQGSIQGFTKAIFSGLPTIELATIIRDLVIPRPDLRGLYHVAAAPIDKYKLLSLVAKTYGKAITITPSDTLIIDRSLNAERFNAATGYVPPAWPELIHRMHAFQTQ